MKTKVKILPTVPVKLAQAKTVESYEGEYAFIVGEQKKLEERKAEIALIVKNKMSADQTSEWGRFRLSVRRSYSWRVEGLKKIFPLKWQAFIECNSKLLKVEMDGGTPELATIAIVKETTALTFVA